MGKTVEALTFRVLFFSDLIEALLVEGEDPLGGGCKKKRRGAGRRKVCIVRLFLLRHGKKGN